MSQSDDVVLQTTRDGASWITINRPDQRNALNNHVLDQLVTAVQRAKLDPAVNSIVLTGAGGRAFCAGGDLKEMGDAQDALMQHRGRAGLAELFHALWGADKPTIARIDGYCLAGGMGVALACDIVLATPESVFGAPEVKAGLWPYMITLPLLRSMQPKAALRLMMTGERVDAHDGLKLGFLTEVVGQEALDARVAEYVTAFRSVSPQALALGRRSFYSALDHDSHGRLEALHASLGLALTMPDAVEGLAAFAEKRPPRWADATITPVAATAAAPGRTTEQ
jgi:enoyl-CoA hydratase/carnithine racemase